MARTGELGGVESIYCGAIDAEVIAPTESDSLIITGAANTVKVNKPGTFRSMPEDCPLTIPTESRQVGDFAVCLSCDRAEVVDRPVTVKP